MGSNTGPLYGWKQIAAHLNRDPRTVQLWEKKRGLPVHRVVGDKNLIWADPAELDAWLHGGSAGPEPAAEAEEDFEHDRYSLESAAAIPAAGTSQAGRAWRTWLLLAVLAAVTLGGLLGWHRSRVPAPVAFKQPPDRIFARAMSHPSSIRTLALKDKGSLNLLTADGEEILHFGSHSVEFIGAAGGRSTGQIPIEGLALSAVTAHRSPLVYFGTVQGNLFRLDRRTRTVVKLQQSLPGRVANLAITPDDATLYLALERGGLHQLYLQDNRLELVPDVSCPAFLQMDPEGRRLFVSQQCALGGVPGRDTVEVRSLPALSLSARFKGQPLVGGALQYSGATHQLWVDGWDACIRYPANRPECPSFPGRVTQIFDLEEGKWIRSIGYPKSEYDSSAVLAGNLALLPGAPIRVLNTQSFGLREEYLAPVPGSGQLIVDPFRRNLYLNAAESPVLIAIRTPDPACSPAQAGLLHYWTFDGASTDLLGGADFRANPKPRFVPGSVGLAVDLSKASQQATAQHDVFVQDSTWSVWIRWEGSGAGRILEARHGAQFWQLMAGAAGELIYRDSKGSSLTSASRLKAGEWVHLILARTAGKASFRWNGKPDSSGPVADLEQPDGAALTAGPFPGAIDELLFYLNPPLEEPAIHALLHMPECFAKDEE